MTTSPEKQVEPRRIVEWTAEPLRPKMVWEGEDEVYDGVVQVQWPGAEPEVAVQVARDGADGPISSLYCTPAEALILAERIRFAAHLAQELGEPGA